MIMKRALTESSMQIGKVKGEFHVTIKKQIITT